MEKIYEPWKNWMGTKIPPPQTPRTPRFRGHSVQFIIIFLNMKFQCCFTWHKYYFPNFSIITMLGSSPMFHLIFILMYIILAQAMNNLEHEECKD